MTIYDHPDDPFSSPPEQPAGVGLARAVIRMRGPGGVIAVPLANLALDLALYPKSHSEVASAWGISEKMLKVTLSRNAMLRDTVTAMKREVENGGAIRAKARLLLDELLPQLQQIATDAITAPRDKNKSIALVAELADALPKSDAGNTNGAMLFAISFGNLEQAAQKAPPPLYTSPSAPIIDVEQEDALIADYSE